MLCRTVMTSPINLQHDSYIEIYFRFLETEDDYFGLQPARVPPQTLAYLCDQSAGTESEKV